MSDGRDEMQRRVNEALANWKGDPRAEEITALRAEVERLRAALKTAGQTYPADGSRLIHSQQQIIDIARAALEGK